MFKRNVTQVGPMKKFKSKREMFKYIAQTISSKLNITRSAHQCENRYISYYYFFFYINYSIVVQYFEKIN